MSKPIILQPGKITQTIESSEKDVFYIDAWTFHIGQKIFFSTKNLKKTDENNLKVLNEIKACADKKPFTIRVLFTSNTIEINLKHPNITVEVLDCQACKQKKRKKAQDGNERPSKKVKTSNDEEEESSDNESSSDEEDQEEDEKLSESDITPGQVYMGLELRLNRDGIPYHPGCSLHK